MEKRVFARYPGRLKFLLYRNSMPVVTCLSENIGPDGMFVRSSPLSYARNTLIDVEFEVRRDTRPSRYRLPAKVVYTTEKGMGLRFEPSGTAENKISHVMLGLLCSELEISATGLDNNDHRAVVCG